jgi:DNA-directed RNA polymerase subunit omega
MEKKISIEDCLGVIPNKFELTVLAMNRAKELLLGAQSEVGDGKFTKKQVNKALKEIGSNMIDLGDLKEKIKEYLRNNDLFSKDIKTAPDVVIATENEIDAIGNDLRDVDIDDSDDEGFDIDPIDDDIENDGR